MSAVAIAPADLAAIEEIKQLKARYFRLLDTKQWDAFGEVFAKDGELRYGEGERDVLRGRERIVARLSEILRDCVTAHHGHMPEIEILGPGEARGIWSMFDYVEHPRYVLRGFGHYTERYRVEDGAWRIASLHLTRLRVERTLKEGL
jgi:hypothetical protein